MKTKTTSLISQYFIISYLLLLINASVFLRQIHYVNFWTIAFSAAVFISYCFIYLAPLFLAIVVIREILKILPVRPFFKSQVFLGILAIPSTAILQILIYADSFIFKMFGFHFNGFVWNLIFTKGGIESMGSSQSTMNSFILTVIFFFFIQTAVFILLIKIEKIKNLSAAVFTRPRVKIALTCIIMFIIFQAIAYGISSFNFYRPVISATKAFPFYMPVTFTRLAKSMGLDAPKRAAFDMKFREISLQYPLKPIEQKADAKKYNIVFLMAESLRADMLNPTVMPQSWAFAQKAIRFNQHYSGGNGTRMGMFAAFYGLYGNYWFNFLEEHKSPVLMNLLIKNKYQLSMYSSAKFSYPEFDKTIFSHLSRSQLHDSSELDNGLEGWRYDRFNVDKMLKFISSSDKVNPFMTFMFFESPHSLYYFPPENEICKPYLEEFNYAEVDLKKDIHLIKNRYINSCNHLDSQFGKILKYLEDNSLLDSTIVILTGDHGEEFMEKGRWGHNSTYSEEQTLVPFVIWVPGQSPRQVDSITSHLDIPATLMTLLGVTNLADDYSEGIDLLGNEQRKYTVISGWDDIAYVDNEDKAVFPMDVLGEEVVTTKYDVEIENSTAFYQNHQQFLLHIMKDMSRFSN
ncbi:MAG: sulfatase-like hydrolase/transferase [Phycisphaerales bacterium]